MCCVWCRTAGRASYERTSAVRSSRASHMNKADATSALIAGGGVGGSATRHPGPLLGGSMLTDSHVSGETRTTGGSTRSTVRSTRAFGSQIDLLGHVPRSCLSDGIRSTSRFSSEEHQATGNHSQQDTPVVAASSQSILRPSLSLICEDQKEGGVPAPAGATAAGL